MECLLFFSPIISRHIAIKRMKENKPRFNTHNGTNACVIIMHKSFPFRNIDKLALAGYYRLYVERARVCMLSFIYIYIYIYIILRYYWIYYSIINK
jgi:hypothetical protein